MRLDCYRVGTGKKKGLEWRAPLGLRFFACRSFTCWPSMFRFARTPTRRHGEGGARTAPTGTHADGAGIDSFAAWLKYGRVAQL